MKWILAFAGITLVLTGGIATSAAPAPLAGAAPPIGAPRVTASLLSVAQRVVTTKLTGGGATGLGNFVRSVALSADGTTAVVGAAEADHYRGAAWVFMRVGPKWRRLAKLTGRGEIGPGEFGQAVALSADGNTAVIGGFADGNDSSIGAGKSPGAVWVFSRSGSTWTQQGEKLRRRGETDISEFGSTVAISADGGTALIGGFDDQGRGAAWAFTRSGSSWSQQSGELPATGIGQGGPSVALSADGNTALIGSFYANKLRGAAWVFTRSGSAWRQQGGTLTGRKESGASGFGAEVALSADGHTALIGGQDDANEVGAVWLFIRTGSVWSQQGRKLRAHGEIGPGEFGISVALSAHGSLALIGGSFDDQKRGAIWMFRRSGSAWRQQPTKLIGGGETGHNIQFGQTLALSADANTALTGGYGVRDVWTFSP